MRCPQGRLVGEPDGGLAQGILTMLGQPHGVFDLLETLGSQEDGARAVSSLLDAGRGQREQREHRDEADGQDGERSENFDERQSLRRCCAVWLHAIGTYGTVTRPDPATVTVICRLLTVSVTV